MTTRTSLAAIALGLCVFVTGCGNSAVKQAAEAKAAAERKTAEERAAAEKKALAEKKADAAPFAGSVSGDEPELDYVVGKMVGKDGKAEFTFGKWRLLFEGVPSDSAGSRVVFQYPSKSGSGEAGETSFNGVKFSQKWDTQANEISVESFRFKLLGKADKLAFKDRTYTATDKTQTIIIDKDGQTRLADKK